VADYNEYTGREELFGLGFPQEGETGTPHDEEVKTAAIGRLLGGMLDALGPGIYSGGVGSLVDGDLVVSALGGLIPDDLGAVPASAALRTWTAAEINNGVSYVHVQLGATAREDGAAAFYVSASATPAPDALLVCKVTKAGGALTAVDNSVRAAPAITVRIPWAGLLRVFGGAETLEELLTAVLGAAYLGATPPTDVDTRLADLEAGGGGGGGGGTTYWGLLQLSSGDSTLISQAIAAAVDVAIATHIVDYHGDTGGGGGTTTAAAEEWDEEAYNFAQTVMHLAHYVPDLPEAHRNVATVVRDHYGHGDGADGLNFVDDAASDW